MVFFSKKDRKTFRTLSGRAAVYVCFFVIVVSTSSVFGELSPNGIDFWENDRLYLPDYGASRNLIMNPSFESGLRYWGFCTFASGIIPLEYSNFYVVDNNEAHSGSCSLRLRALTLKNSLPLGTFAIPLNANTDYTLSFYAKGNLASYLTLNVWGRGLASTPVSRGVAVNNQWQRYTISFKANDRFVSMYFDAQLSTYSGEPEGCIWIDDIQLESASAATAFTQAPVAAQLVSAARGNFLEFGQEPNFNLIIQSLSDADGTVSLSVEDFFFNNVFTEMYPFTTDPNGKSTIILDKLSSAILASNLRGVFVVTGVFNISGVSRPYTDYFRFSVMDFLDNTHKNKDLFNLTYVYHLQSGGPEFVRFLERERAIGFGSITYDFGIFGNDLNYDLDSERMQMLSDYGFTHVGRPVLKHGGSEISEANGLYKMTNINNKTNPSAIELADFQNICKIKAQNRYWNTIWWFCGESSAGCVPLESYPDAFGKFLLATCKGIKQGNPQAKVLIEGGPWKLDAQSTGWVERYIQDTKRINPAVQFDGAAAHHYRNFPENPDLDSDIAAFLSMLDRNGCGNWPFYINEGGNYCPLDIPEENISPYVVHSANSWNMGPLSYHYGRSERISAGFTARNWLVALKYQDRVACMNDFMTPNRYVDIDFTPRPYDKIPNTLGRILGNVSFDRDIQFAPNCRGYLFTEDATGAPIAALWGYKESIDRWQESSLVYTFDFGVQNVKFIDLMENEVVFPTNCDGRTSIPISPFPLFIKGLPGTENQLCNAIAAYQYGTGMPVPIMDGTLHNGSVTASEAGYWSSNPNSIPAGWVQETPTAYQAGGGGWTMITSNGIVLNNTGELVPANRQYTIQADLGGFDGYIATVNVYATQNANGTGNKVLLTSVSRMGNNSIDGYSLFTVSDTSPMAPPSVTGYYVQVSLEGSGYYDNIVLTLVPEIASICGDAGHPFPVGDINQDCYVNLQDFTILAGQWLAENCLDPDWCDGADLTYNTTVSLQDFELLASNWLSCTDPIPPCCFNP